MIRFECSICGSISPSVRVEDNPGDRVPDYLPDGWVEYHRDSNGPKFACGDELVTQR